MERPRQKYGRLPLFLAAMSTAAIGLIALSGFISSNDERHKVEGDPINIEALMKRVLDLNQSKQHQKAIDLLLATVDKQPDDSILRTLLMQTFDLFLETEIRSGQKDIAANPKNMAAYQRTSGALELVGDKMRAQEILLNALPHKTDSSDIWMRIARLELKAGRENEALDVFRHVVKLDRKNSDAYNNAAYILVRTENSDAEDLAEAEAMAKSARKLDPKNPEYLDTLAEVRFRQGDSKMAQSLIEEAIRLAPEREGLRDQLRRFRGGMGSFKAE